MLKDRNKIMALAALVVLWAGTFVWYWQSEEEPVRVPLTNVSGPASQVSTSRGMGSGGRVQLELLAGARTQREMTFTTPRNIFAPPRPDGAGISGGGGPAHDPNEELALRRQAVAVELAQFHYLGFVRLEEEPQPRKGTLAVLTKNDDVHIVKAGEVVENHVVVKTIGQESVTLQDRDSRIEYTVLLSDEALAQP